MRKAPLPLRPEGGCPGPLFNGERIRRAEAVFRHPPVDHLARRPRQPLRRRGLLLLPSALFRLLCLPLSSSLHFASHCKMQGETPPSLAFCRQGALFFSSYHPEKEHSLSLARPMLKGNVPRPPPGRRAAFLRGAGRAPGNLQPHVRAAARRPRRLEKGPARLWTRGAPGPDARLSEPRCRACAAGWPVALPKGTAAPSGQGRHSCAARAGSRREHRSSSVWRRLCLSE